MRKFLPSHPNKYILYCFCSLLFFLPALAYAAAEGSESIFHTNTFLFSALLFCLILLGIVSKQLRITSKQNKESQQQLKTYQEQIRLYSQQIDQFGVASASMLSIEDETVLFKMISESITQYSDYNRVMVSLFKEEYPHREIIGHSGLEEQTVEWMTSVALSKSYFDKICQLAEKIGQFSYYVPHTRKHVFNQDAVAYGEGEVPADENQWHPHDNLLVKMRDNHGNFIGIISVDSSKSGLCPTAELVRPLEIFASFISQIILVKRGQQRQQDLQEQLDRVQRMETIGNMAGGIAHDFNNSLGLILGNSDLALLHAPPESPIHSNLQAIKDAGTKAKDIIQQLLSYSKKSTNEFTVINAVTTIEETINFLRSTIPATIEIQQNIQTNEALVLTDPNQLGQIIINLSSNSSDAMEKNGGILSISINTIHIKTDTVGVPGDIAEGHWARILISDTGTGIQQDIIHQIFDPHFTTKTESGNKGMGLTQVKELVEKHNGKITIDSSRNYGTTFTIYLPLYQEEKSHDETIPAPTLTGSEHILFIDDDNSLLSLGKLMLEQLGYIVQAESDPLEAIKYFEENPAEYDLIITDMTMPQMTGDILARKLLAIDPETKIILCTGYSDIISKEEALGLGIKGYYEKPLTIQPFSKAIRSVLGDTNN